MGKCKLCPTVTPESEIIMTEERVEDVKKKVIDRLKKLGQDRAPEFIFEDQRGLVIGVSSIFDRCPRTSIYEDRKFMINRLGAPIKRDSTRNGWYYTDPTYFLPAIMLTSEEITAFFLGEQLFTRYLGTSFETPLRLALDKIKQSLPLGVSYDLQQEAAAFAFTGGGRAMVDPELLLETQ